MFNLTLAKCELQTPLMIVAGAVDKKNSLAILSNILLKADENGLTLLATDLEMEIAAQIPCQTTQPGIITVPAKKMIDIIRSLDESSEILISQQASSVLIKSGQSVFKLATLPAEDFPNSESDANLLEGYLSRKELIRLFQTTFFSMSQQDVRVFLNALLLEFDGHGITAVSTDGHRMSIYKISTQTSYNHCRLLLPRKSIQELLKILSSIDEEQVQIEVGKNFFKLLTRQYSFCSRLIEARFPPYAKALPRDLDKFVTLNRDILKRALARIIIIANEKSHAILLHIQANLLTLTAHNQEEEATEILDAHTEGGDLKIALNAGYLLEFLHVIEDGDVRLSFSTTDKSFLVESLAENQYQYIIMPMTL